MRKAIPLRLDHDAVGLRGLERASKDADQVRRLLALALISDGGSRTQAAAAGGVTLQVCVIGFCGSTRTVRGD